jgi:hypothetical protein
LNTTLNRARLRFPRKPIDRDEDCVTTNGLYCG